MAGLRLLTVVFLVLAVLGVAGRCEGKPFVAPRIAGRIVDKRTGQPVAGMTVFVWYEYDVTWSAEPKGGGFGTRWQETDAEGRFDFPEQVAAERVSRQVRVEPVPNVQLLHRDYGRPLVLLPDDPTQWSNVEFRIEPDRMTLEWIRDTRAHGARICGGPWGQEAYQHCCEVAWGKRCEDVGR